MNATAPGRMQIIHKSPEWLIDVAHNPHAAKALAKYLEQYPVKGKTYALFSMLTDKDISQVLSILENNIDEWHIIGLSSSRGYTVSKLKQAIKRQNLSHDIIAHKNISTACHTLKNRSKYEDRVVAFGSFLVVSAVINNCNL